MCAPPRGERGQKARNVVGKNWSRQRQKPAKPVHAKPGAQASPMREKISRHQAMR